MPDTNLRLLPRPSVVVRVSSPMREHNFTFDWITSSHLNNPYSVEEDDHLYEEILIVDHRHRIAQIFDQEESLPPPSLPQQPLSARDGWSDDVQPILESSWTASSAASTMPSPASLFETPVVFNGYFNFLFRKIIHRSLSIPPE